LLSEATTIALRPPISARPEMMPTLFSRFSAVERLLDGLGDLALFLA